MRARYPDQEGVVHHDGLSLGYEVYGSGSPTILLMPSWTIVNVRFWKAQIHYLARHFRVVTFDGPGNGRSDRPTTSSFYDHAAVVADAVTVLNASNTERAVLVSLSQGASWSLQMTADFRDRVMGQVFIGPTLPLVQPDPAREKVFGRFEEVIPNPRGWEKYNVHYWRSNYPDFAEFFFSQAVSEPHSTKQREDAVGWALETTSDVLIAEDRSAGAPVTREDTLELCRQVDSPVLVIHGTGDRISPFECGRTLAEACGGDLLAIEGGGHFAMSRDPVIVNLAIRTFVERLVA